MSCPTEAELAVHADEELPLDQARRIEAHLAACPRCRALLDALHGENRLLVRILDEAVAPAPHPAAVWTELVTAGLAALAAVVGFEALGGWLVALGRETPLGLLDTRSLLLKALFEAAFYLLQEGASMLTSLLTSFGLVALVVLSALFGLSLRRRWTAGGLLLLAVAGLAPSASALERRVVRGERESVVVRAGETVDDSLFATGETVSVDGVVTGNLIAFARRVIVRGTVKGDLLTGAQRVELEGSVEGNVVSFAETVALRGPVGKSFHGFAHHVGIEREGRVEGDFVAFAAEADVEGRVGRDALAFAGLTTLRGEVARNASAWTGRLRVEAPANIGGNLTAHVDKKGNVLVDPQAKVGGRTETRVNERASRRSRYTRLSFYLWRAIWLAAAFLTGMIVRRLLPSLFAARLGDALSVLKPMGIGFLALVAPPVAIVIMALTMVGLPLAFLALGLWLAGLYLSSIQVGAQVGRALLARGEGAAPSFGLDLFVGLLIVTVAVNIPYLGGLVRLVVLLLGLGLSAIQVWRAWRPAAAA